MKKMIFALVAASLLTAPEIQSFSAGNHLSKPLRITLGVAAVGLTAYALYQIAATTPTYAEQVITIEFDPAATVKIQDMRAAFDGRAMSEKLFLQALQQTALSHGITVTKRTALQDGFIRLEIHYKGPQQSAESIYAMALGYLSLRVGQVTTTTLEIIDRNAGLEKPAPAELVDL